MSDPNLLTPSSNGDDESSLEEAVRVFVRIRPLNKREVAEKQTIGWSFNETSMLEDTPNGQRVYAYDNCFGPNTTNKETYEIVGKPLVIKAMEGYNGTVFTYGQTGSGKTWTMRGSESDPGMMVLCVRDLMDYISQHQEMEFKLKVAYMEVYNEEINDLLGDQTPASKNLKIISEDATRGAVIGGLVEIPASTPEDFMEILAKGEAARSYASTGMNENSSRSHTIYRVSIETRMRDPDGDNNNSNGTGGMNGGMNGFNMNGGDGDSTSRISYLNLVDLAGSERQKSTKAEGRILKEGANINKSLLALGAVINKLGEAAKKPKSGGGKPSFIPYRDSKLTRILKQSLGGNTMTSVLCAVTPAPMHREETVSTLKFGQLCKSIKNQVKANDGLMDDRSLIKQLRATIVELRAQIESLEANNGVNSNDISNGNNGTVDGEVSSVIVNELKSQNKDLEAKMLQMEKLILSKGGNLEEIRSSIQNLNEFSLVDNNHLPPIPSRYEFRLLTQQLSDCKLRLEEYETNQLGFEEYETHTRSELDDLSTRLIEEREVLQNDRHKFLKDCSVLGEKEARVGQLFSLLDERESKLRQIQAGLREQLDQWNRSVSDLKKREDLVDDWERTHRNREARLAERDATLDRKANELQMRENVVKEEENRAKQASMELGEREQRLQLGLSRVANGELANTAKEESLQQFEASLHRKEAENDRREREFAGRRKELESWDVLLREKDRKVTTEQRLLDEREARVSQLEEEIRVAQAEVDRRTAENKSLDTQLRDKLSTAESQLEELEGRERELRDKERDCASLHRQLLSREEEFKRWEERLAKLQMAMRGIETREQALSAAEAALRAKQERFYGVEVAQITARHLAEQRRLKEQVDVQLGMVEAYDREITSLKEEHSTAQATINELRTLLHTRESELAEVINAAAMEASGAVGGTADSSVCDETINDTGLEVTGDVVVAPSPNEQDTNDNTVNNSPVHITIPSQNQAPPRLPPTPTPSSNNLPFGTAAANMYGAVGTMPTMALAGNDFLTQLAVTRGAIYRLLEKYDALPGASNSVLGPSPIPSTFLSRQRKGAAGKSRNPSPPPPPPMEMGSFASPIPESLQAEELADMDRLISTVEGAVNISQVHSTVSAVKGRTRPGTTRKAYTDTGLQRRVNGGNSTLSSSRGPLRMSNLASPPSSKGAHRTVDLSQLVTQKQTGGVSVTHLELDMRSRRLARAMNLPKSPPPPRGVRHGSPISGVVLGRRSQ